MSSLLDTLRTVPSAVWVGVSIASIAMSIAGVAAVPWMVCRMPADWFSRAPQHWTERLRAAPVATVARNALGLALVLLGIALLFLPGQGVLTIMLGVVLTDLPLRDHGLRWVASRPRLAAQMQRWRSKARVPKFTGLPE